MMEETLIRSGNAGSLSGRGRILIRGVNWLGDAVMTMPALERLREAHPGAQITLLTHERLADLWQAHPSLDSLLTFASGESPWRLARRLRTAHFDIALVLPKSPRAALEVWLAGIPDRIGYRGAPWRSWFLTHPVRLPAVTMRMRKRTKAEIRRLIREQASGPAAPVPPAVHQTADYLRLVSALGANPEPVPPRLYVSKAETEATGMRFGVLTGDAQRGLLFGLNGGAEYGPAKRWPRERFVEAAIELQRRTGCRWIIFGGQGDRESADVISSQIERAAGGRSTRGASRAVLNLAGMTTLRELCALLRLCQVLLTNDTGPMHVAAAVGTPVVVPFGSTSPEFTGPGLPGDTRHRLLRTIAPCAPCFRRVCPIDFRCMKTITVEQVVQAVLEVTGAEQL
jgi:heptosyltransferase-2